MSSHPTFPRSRSRPARATRRAILRASAATLGGVLAGSVVKRAPALAQEPAAATPVAPVPAVPPEVARFAADWPMAQGNYAAHRASATSPISAENCDLLDVAWRFPIDAVSGYGAVTANPIVLGDTVYLQDMASNVFAIDRAAGELRWRRDYGLPTAGSNGIAAGYGLAFGVVGIGAEVFALDSQTGDEVWRTRLSANPAEFVFVQPQVYDGVVYVSTSPAAYVPGSRGIFFALSAESGHVLWQWDTTTDNLWGAARLNSGGGVWYPPSIDEAGNLYFGTGNPGPWPEEDPARTTRPGPNLYSSSMVSLDPATGSLRWHLQAAPHDQLDHDFQHSPILATVEIDGTPRRLAIGGGKTGTVIAADAGTGEEIWRTSVGEHTPAGDGGVLPEAAGTPVVVAPGFFGGVLTPMAYAHETVFVPVINLPLVYTETESSFDLADATGEMVALSAIDGRQLWSTPVATFFSGGATVANDVVFGAGLDGIVRGFAIDDGREVWRFQLGAGINAPLAVAGDTLLVAAGAFFIGAGEDAPEPRPELVAFRLPTEGAHVPGTPPAGEGSATPIPG